MALEASPSRFDPALRRAILAGQLAPGTRLPAIRALAHELSVSRNTVFSRTTSSWPKANTVGHTGSGTYVAKALDATPSPRLTVSRRCARAQAPPCASPPTADGWRKNGSFPRRMLYPTVLPCATIFAMACRMWQRSPMRPGGDCWRAGRVVSVHALHYGPPASYAPLRQAIAAYVRRAVPCSVSPRRSLSSTARSRRLTYIARVLLDGETGAARGAPLSGPRQVFLAAGARLITVPVDTEGLLTTALPDADAAARLVYVTPSHQFPTGAVMSLVRRLALRQWAETTEAYVLEDDYHSGFPMPGGR